jgi:LAO/AO transport system kinase
MREDLSALALGVRAGEERALAAAITMAEAGEAHDLLSFLEPNVHKPVLGITGAPGVGKSSIVSSMVGMIREQDVLVAALLVDPSSVLTGGSLLGDRIRLQKHASDRGVFIRSLAARGHLGGLTQHIDQVIAVLRGSPFAIILLETVGVGQSEVEIMHHADAVCFVVTPSHGDGVQAAKAGILEIADVIALNKSDLPAANLSFRELTGADLVSRKTKQPVKVIHTIALDDIGVGDVLAELLDIAES